MSSYVRGDLIKFNASSLINWVFFFLYSSLCLLVMDRIAVSKYWYYNILILFLIMNCYFCSKNRKKKNSSTLEGTTSCWWSGTTCWLMKWPASGLFLSCLENKLSCLLLWVVINARLMYGLLSLFSRRHHIEERYSIVTTLRLKSVVIISTDLDFDNVKGRKMPVRLSITSSL